MAYSNKCLILAHATYPSGWEDHSGSQAYKTAIASIIASKSPGGSHTASEMLWPESDTCCVCLELTGQQWSHGPSQPQEGLEV